MKSRMHLHRRLSGVPSRLFSGIQYSHLTIAGRKVFVMREDMNVVCGLTGNKGRKLYNIAMSNSFPRAIISYGGPQSNSMLALAKLAHSKRSCEFIYFTKNIPKTTKSMNVGNYAMAVDLNMQHFQLPNDVYSILHDECIPSPSGYAIPSPIISILKSYYIPRDCLWSDVWWVPQGGYMAGASEGIELLAREVHDFVLAQAPSNGYDWKVVVESGTGTTAAFLAKHLCKVQSRTRESHPADNKPNIEVVAVSCVMAPDQLMKSIHKVLANCRDDYPNGPNFSLVLPPNLSVLSYPSALMDKCKGKRRVFGRPVKDHYELWKDIKEQSKIEFDLVYAPAAWEQLIHSPEWVGSSRESHKLSDDAWSVHTNVIYIHCGGTEGNATQLMRYRHKFGFDISD